MITLTATTNILLYLTSVGQEAGSYFFVSAMEIAVYNPGSGWHGLCAKVIIQSRCPYDCHRRNNGSAVLYRKTHTETASARAENLDVVRTFISVDPPVLLHTLGQTGRLKLAIVQLAPVYPSHERNHSVDLSHEIVYP